MKRENEAKLFKRFKFFHPEKPPQQSNMCFGFECSNGWFDLVWKLCIDIENALGRERTKSSKCNFEVTQVKEKYGGLRFDGMGGTEETVDLIEKAENKSYTICEICGQKGELRVGPYIQTLCDKHYKRVGK